MGGLSPSLRTTQPGSDNPDWNPRPAETNVAVPLPDETDIEKTVGDGYNPESTLHVLKMFAGTEDMYPALIGIVQAMFGTSGIDAKHREVIILRAASALNCPYEWQANAQMASNAGLTGTEIDALAADGPVHGINAEYALLDTATDELLKSGHSPTPRSKPCSTPSTRSGPASTSP